MGGAGLDETMRKDTRCADTAECAITIVGDARGNAALSDPTPGARSNREQAEGRPKIGRSCAVRTQKKKDPPKRVFP